jgi:predicted secreted hydrolase
MLMKRILWIGLVLLALILLWSNWIGGSVKPDTQPPNVLLEKKSSTGGFTQALEPQTFEFPKDHGPHLDYQTEWWYFTGNLETNQGRHFGYQLTFFRRGLSPGTQTRPSSLATNQVFFAHLAITDVTGNEHKEVERFSRGIERLAGANGDPFRVWLEDWSLTALNEDGSHLQLSAMEGGLRLDLELQSKKPIVAHGLNGLSPKGIEPGNASYYLSYTRMQTSGSIWIDSETFKVEGESWFDHEWSTTVLGENALGWDWFGLHLSDDRELMFFLIRNEDGSIGQTSGGTLVEPDGSVTTFNQNMLDVEVLSRWVSPETGAEYPSSWTLSIPTLDLNLNIEPWISDQEMRLSLVYWEGAVKVNGKSKGISITGQGYAELTGYAYSFQGIF